MFSKFKFSELLNIISIGVLTQMFLLIFFCCIFPEYIYFLLGKTLTKELSVLVIAISVIIAIPLWRIISAFVEILMYTISSVESRSKIFKLIINLQSIYRQVFFLLNKASSINQAQILLDELKSSASENNITEIHYFSDDNPY